MSKRFYSSPTGFKSYPNVVAIPSSQFQAGGERKPQRSSRITAVAESTNSSQRVLSSSDCLHGHQEIQLERQITFLQLYLVDDSGILTKGS